MIHYVKNADIFHLNTEAIVNTVNCVGVMGKGIALQFKQKYPDNFKAYKHAVDRGEIKIGKMFVHQISFVDNPKFIINFPTKNHWIGKSNINFVSQGLDALVKSIVDYDIKSIAIPPLGCGNGGLDWAEVKSLISSKLSHLDVDISVVEPNSHFRDIKNTKQVSLTPFRAVLIKIIKYYNDSLGELGNLEIQKLVYFQNIVMGNTKLKYVKHRYGPYCPNLHNALDALSGTYLSGVGDGDKNNQISLSALAECAADDYIKTNDPSLLQTIENINHIISGFEGHFGMELLGTVHWVVKEENAQTLDEVIKKVHDWNSRKKAIMKEKDIEVAFKRLKDCGLV